MLRSLIKSRRRQARQRHLSVPIKAPVRAGLEALESRLLLAAYSLWDPATTTPAIPAFDADTNSYELGVKFRSTEVGSVTGIRFYRGTGNDAAAGRQGHLWSSTGTLLGSTETFDERTTGWLEANFVNPIAIQANTIYVASVTYPVGRYAVDVGYFATNGVTSGPLQAPASPVDVNGNYPDPNGVFVPDPTPTIDSPLFPSFGNDDNYWVDVVFETAVTPIGAPIVGTATINEDTEANITVLPAAGASTVTGFQISGITNGSVYVQGSPTPLANGDAITLAQGAAGLRVVPAANYFGTVSFNVQSLEGGTLVGPVAQGLVTVNPVNDAPSFTLAGTVPTLPANAGPQSIPDFLTNISAGPANESDQTLGLVVSNDNPALFSVQPAIALNGTLSFTPAPGASGTALVTVVLQDSGGTANGGVDSSAPATFTITVEPAAPQQGRIIVQKQTLPDGSTQQFQFNASYDADGFVLSDNQSSDSGLLDAGTYTLSEVVPAGWMSSSITVSGDDGGSTVNDNSATLDLDAGETLTVTVTNTQMGRIIVDKVTSPAGSTQQFEFDPSWGANFFLSDTAAPYNSGYLAPGAFSIQEINIPAGWSLSSAVASDGSPVNELQLDPGEVITVTFTNAQARYEGLSHGFWKNHTNQWRGYSPNQTLESVFDIPDQYGLDNYTLLQALKFDGGSKVADAAKILLRQAVAALLNAAHPEITYRYSVAEVINLTNTALASGNRPTMLNLKDVFDYWNNRGGGIDAHGRPI